jgi:hypothetical protein
VLIGEDKGVMMKKRDSVFTHLNPDKDVCNHLLPDNIAAELSQQQGFREIFQNFRGEAKKYVRKP